MSAPRGHRLAAGVGLLVCLWIGVYWAWEPKADRVSMHRVEQPAIEPLLEEDLDEPEELELSGVMELLQGRPELGPQSEGTESETATSESEAPEPMHRDYIVRRGDTFESIAREHLGDSSLWTVLARENPFVSPDRLTPGAVIRIPTTENSRPEPAMPSAIPRDAEYVVVSGDSLSTISQRVYGTSKYTDALFRANRGVLRSPDSLRIGQVLTIPPLEVISGNGGSP